MSMRLKLGVPALGGVLLALVGCVSLPQRTAGGYWSAKDDIVLAALNTKLEEFGIRDAHAEVDSQGRVALVGQFRNDDEADQAFWIASAMVGPEGLSTAVPPVKDADSKASQCLGAAISGQAMPPGCPGAPVIPDSERLPPSKTSHKYALLVGINQFSGLTVFREGRNTGGQLRYAVADAQAFSDYLKHEAGFDDVRTLLNGQATNESIKATLHDIVRRADANDTLVVYFATHGMPMRVSEWNNTPNLRAGLDLVTYDTVWSNQSLRAPSHSFSFGELKQYLSSSRAGKQLVILDVCYSGNALGLDAAENYQGLRYASGVSEDGLEALNAGARDLLTAEDIERPASDQRRVVSIAGSGPGQKVWECNKFEHGCFSHFFLDGLKRFSGDVESAFDVAQQKTPAEVDNLPKVREEETKTGKDVSQEPTISYEPRQGWNFSLAK